jgi:hypothetical protein
VTTGSPFALVDEGAAKLEAARSAAAEQGL